jgi:serine/threonine protein kinase
VGTGQHPPLKISRYLIEDELGSGGFGIVYLAYDTELDRKVAIKVFQKEAIGALSPERELRALARLDHPGIVPIYDTGVHDACPYLVSKYVPGPTLRDCLRTRTFEPSAAADLVALICDAVAHAHGRGVILRDIKPSNIILEDGTRPVLIDFGIALFEHDFGIDSLRSAGTLAYMCPEQANGSGHLLDPRSDVYSLGAILYEMLSGHVPFDGNTQTTVTKIRQSEPARPSLRNHDIPGGLEQICTKALSKSPNGRYVSATEMAEALREPKLDLIPPRAHTARSFTPKGLRAFDGDDAEHFLDLLPGPISASGLPESIHFWTSRIGSHAGSSPSRPRFKVGVIHGLSGSGKSSLLRAGILPRLDPSVDRIFTEAASGTIEQRLLSSLLNLHPEIDPTADLPTAIRSIKEKDEHRTLLIAIDQFEQWLRDWDGGHGSQLARALKACDGNLIQCIIVVRDDFWTCMCQFMDAIGCELHQNHNSRAAELFAISHAREILIKFGKALGSLADQPGESELEFVERAIQSLAAESEGKVSPIQIALLADVFKDRPWHVAELDKLGGTKAIGTLFLDQSFLHRSAPTRNRFHAAAATKVLGSLLPANDLEIRGASKRVDEISEASGYSNNPQAFCHLLQILDTELRLITPHESPGSDDTIARYQLTHDYLVPSIRGWLDRQRSDTARGRAELRLERLSAAYSLDKDKRHIPGWLDYLRIRNLTDRHRWSEVQADLMRLAGIRVLSASLLAALALGVLTMFGLHLLGRAKVQHWLADLRAFPSEEIAPLLGEQFPHKKVEADEVQRFFDTAETGSSKRFNLGLALMQLNPSDELASELFEHLLEARPLEFKACYQSLMESDERFASRASVPSNRPARLAALLACQADLSLVNTRAALENFLDQRPDLLAEWLRVSPGVPKLLELLSEYEIFWQDKNDEPESDFDPEHERRLAMSVLARHLLGEGSAIFDCLELQGIPVRHAYLIDALAPRVIAQADLLTQLAARPSPRVAAAVLLALQAYSPAGQSPPKELMRFAEDACARAADAYLHSAAESLYRHWGAAAPEIRKDFPDPAAPGLWFNAHDGSKMVIIRPQPGHAKIPHDFAISSSPVRFDHYRKHQLPGNGVKGHGEPGFPVYDLNMFHAMRYCNALSDEANLERCYNESPGGFGKMEPVPDYLDKSGYRLPTCAEMTLASRGTPIECVVPAEVIDLVDRYEWTRRNSQNRFHVPGSLRPNEFGLFDTLSNFSEWLLDPLAFPPDMVDPKDRRFHFQHYTFQRSQYFDTPASLIKVGAYGPFVPENALSATFRLVRSLPE